MPKSQTSVKDKDIINKINRLKKSGQFNMAVELCRSVLETDPLNADLHIKLGDLYLEWHLDIYQHRQYLDEAVTEFQMALETYLKSSSLHYKIALAFYYKGEFDKAAKRLKTALEIDDKFYEAYYLSAKILTKKGQFSEALELLENAIKYGGLMAARAHYLYAVLFRYRSGKDMGLKFKAFYHFCAAALKLIFDKQALGSIKRTISYVRFIPILTKGYFLEKSGKFDDAIELYLKGIEKAPRFLFFYVVLGDIYRQTGRFFDAVNEYRMAVWVDSANPIGYRSLCALYEEAGDYDSAINVYKKLINLQPTDATYYSNLGNLFYLKGEPQFAVSCYQTAITLNPNKNWTSIVAQTLGFILQESRENYDAAIAAYQTAGILNPNDIDVYISLGSAFYEKGDYGNALTVYRSALEIVPDNARIHCNLAYLLWGKGHIDEAVKEYETSIKIDPEYDIAYNNLGVIYLDDLGKVKEAVEMFEKAVKYNPNYALANYNLARATAIKGDKVTAAKLYRSALELNSFSGELDNNEIKLRIDDLFN
jgi:tetratricopeptide (TPR) repeat protein